MTDRNRRAEEARQKILDSGDPELIKRLYLLEAAQAPREAGRTGPSLLGTGLAVAGGAWLGTVLAGMTLSGEMRGAFSVVAEDIGLDPGGLDAAGTDIADAGSVAEAGEATEAGFLDDLGLGDLGDFFDV